MSVNGGSSGRRWKMEGGVMVVTECWEKREGMSYEKYLKRYNLKNIKKGNIIIMFKLRRQEFFFNN